MKKKIKKPNKNKEDKIIDKLLINSGFNDIEGYEKFRKNNYKSIGFKKVESYLDSLFKNEEFLKVIKKTREHFGILECGYKVNYYGGV